MRKTYFYMSLAILVVIGAVAGYRWAKTTSKKEQMRDPAFRAKVEYDLGMRRPVNAPIKWDDLSGDKLSHFPA